jgi:phosphosulfolactate phosphohydrolase-like enzyme
MVPSATTVLKNGSRPATYGLNGDDMLHRIDPRLRRLVVRACHNSYAAAKVVELFESFIVQSFTNDKKSTLLTDCWWSDLLLECPTLTHRRDSRRSTAQFFFHPTLPTGGFHRLLLHAVCQFHGLNVVSRTEENYECIWGNGETTNGTRVLTATGDIIDGTSSTNRVLLLQHLGENVNDSI